MKIDNYLVNIIDNKDNIILEQKYATLSDIQKDFPKINYSLIRTLYLYTTNQTSKKPHPKTLKLMKYMKIYDYKDDVIPSI